MQWYLKVLRQYADFAGRARRREYWMFTLVNLIVSIVLAVVDTALGLQVQATPGFGSGVLGLLYSLAVLVPSLAVVARRLHDTDRSGWWQLLSVVPFALLVLLPLVGDDGAALIVLGLVMLVAVIAMIVLIVWLATNGRPGTNRFGPNPKEITGPAVA